ncbi:hypothetical protein KJ903_02735 [Patescibacteria group bacterium]|nr:hypothetical protein [Patescibacteria group bacterium]
MIKRVSQAIVCLLVLTLGLFVLVGDNVASATDFGLSYVKDSGVVTSSWGVVVGRIIQAVLGLVGVLLLVMMIYGGILYMTSAGSEERIGSAKKVLSYSIFGAIIIALAFTLTSYIINALFGK